MCRPWACSQDASFSRCRPYLHQRSSTITRWRFLDFCFAERLLARDRVCPMCFLNMKLMPRRQVTDKLAWHCRDNFCGSGSYHSVRRGSFFGSSRVPIKKAIRLWAQDSSVKAAADTLDVSRQCVQQHF